MTRKAKSSGDLKLDLGCGQNPAPGFKGVDLYAKADYKTDLFKFPWPFKDGSVDELYSNQFVEHIPNHLRFRFFDECWRILKPEGKFTVICPYYTSMRAVQDPTHEWPPICEASFLYYNRGWREQNKLTHYPVKANFDFTFGYGLDPETSQRSQESQPFWIKHYANSVTDIIVNLTKKL